MSLSPILASVASGWPSLWQAAGIVGLGALPIAEGNVAVPVALMEGMHPVVGVSLSVLGTTAQTLLTRGFADWLFKWPPLARWWERRMAKRRRPFLAGNGANWVILLGIPWLGGVPTALGSRVAGIGDARYVRWAVGGLVLHAGTLALLIRLGLHAAGRR